MLDKFGTGVKITLDDEERFLTSFTAAPYGLEFWAFQYLPHIKVIEPKHLRESIAETLKHNPYLDISKAD